MVDNRSHQNIIVNGGEMLNFMPNQIYIVNEPLRFPNGVTGMNNLEREKKFIEFKDLSRCEETNISRVEGSNSEQITLVQMVWNQPEPEYQAHFMALNENILTDHNNSISQNAQISIPVLEIEDTDEDDDVVFVGAYQKQSELDNKIEPIVEIVEKSSPNHMETKKPRRNPSRKARNNKFGKSDNDDNIYEEDFCLLDSTDDESSPDELISATQSEIEDKPQNLSVKDLKKWPVNGLHERPEFNTVTQKIEKFDYTIREIQKKVKPQKQEETKKVKPKKPAAKKYIAKKRTAKGKSVKKVDDKVPLNSVKELIGENYKLLSIFIKNVRTQREQDLHACHNIVLGSKNKENVPVPTNTESCEVTEDGGHKICEDNYENLMINQSRLFSLMNEISFQEAYDGLKKESQ